MAEPIQLNFGHRAASARSQRNRYARCINLIKEVKDRAITLYGRPGRSLIAEKDGGPTRALVVANDYLYYISNKFVYRVSNSLTTIKIGELDSSNGKASMEFDGFYITIVDGVGFYTYDVNTGTFARNTDSSIPIGATELMFIDGFHYINEPSTGRFHTHSLAFEPNGAWDADQATAEYSGDYLLSMVRDSSYAYMFGTNTTEIWEPDNQGNFPLKPNLGAYLEYGTAAAGTPIQFANGVHWLARDRKGGYLAMRAEGLRPKRVSTTELETEWNSYSRVDDAYSMSWHIAGHMLWLLNFPTANKTWVYDESVPEPDLRWSEFQLYHPDPEERKGIEGSDSVFFTTTQYGSVIIMGDKTSGKLWKVSFDDLDDAGTQIQAIVSSQEIIALDNSYVDHPEVELYIETGVGDVKANDPKIRLRYSDDHGNTWTNKQWTSIGKEGEYTKRIRFRGLGRSRHRYYELMWSDPVRRAMLSAIVRRDGVANATQ